MAGVRLSWGLNTPAGVATHINKIRRGMPKKATSIVTDVAERGAERMRGIILAGGMNPTTKGGARVESGQMLGSVEVLDEGGGDTPSKRFGFSNGMPGWTLWQEQGTVGGQGNGTGISQMLAFAQARLDASEALIDAVQGTAWMKPGTATAMTGKFS